MKQPVTSKIFITLKVNSSELLNTTNINYNPDIQEPQSYSILNNNKINELQLNTKDNSSTDKVFEKNKKLKKDDNCKSKKDNVNIKQIWHKLDILSKNLRCNRFG